MTVTADVMGTGFDDTAKAHFVEMGTFADDVDMMTFADDVDMVTSDDVEKENTDVFDTVRPALLLFQIVLQADIVFLACMSWIHCTTCYPAPTLTLPTLLVYY